jgi:hydrogenase maturation factor HypF (carbamoyltransferase family)
MTLSNDSVTVGASSTGEVNDAVLKAVTITEAKVFEGQTNVTNNYSFTASSDKATVQNVLDDEEKAIKN